ncbi:hypothetical protein KGP95_24055 [Burkholderia multivorans]|uniref:hypothetical protein n=1 Tax=Burkholderia multivorans TaxID=87883 RepID=UPI00209E343F|nr:hypothetical protein [Burkholderia multivorans]MCO8613454.1 hypothetical protein [Burkholderia multivorans]MCO8640410.1 hypothetical protein [Burkholderia multivorans]MCO8649365.1 hypothetical protein [Burkholderia multivorans]
MGELDQDRLMDAISNAATIAAGKARWTITNVFDQRNTSRPFLFGKLSKFSDEGHVKLVDTKRRSEVDAIAENP